MEYPGKIKYLILLYIINFKKLGYGVYKGDPNDGIIQKDAESIYAFLI